MKGKDDRAREDEIRRARSHPLRRAMLDRLDGGAVLSGRELQAGLPAGTPLSVIHYHLKVLVYTELAACVNGLYRLP